ncbi:MAG: radical SAM peptide maturase [bacterium]
MYSAIAFKTKNKSTYFFDINKNSLVLCHPILFEIVRMGSRMAKSGEILSGPSWTDSLSQGEFGSVPRDILAFYVEKYRLLQKNGYFREVDKSSKTYRISAYTVRDSLANTHQIVFEVTGRCNLCCEYCGYGDLYSQVDKKRSTRNLDTKSAMRLIDYVLKLVVSPYNHSADKKLHISFYGGEPLLRIGFIKEVVDYVRSCMGHGISLTLGMTTNGTYLRKYSDYLVKNNFNLLVSLDGNEKNNSYRLFHNGKPSFQVVLQNIKYLARTYPRYFEKRVSFNSVFNGRSTLSDVCEFFKSEFNMKPKIAEINLHGILQSKRAIFEKMYKSVVDALTEEAEGERYEEEMPSVFPRTNTAIRFVHRCNSAMFEDYDDLLDPVDNRSSYITGTCLPFAKKIFLSAGRNILPCEKVSQEFVLGKVEDSGEVAIDFESIAALYNGYYRKIEELCSNCYNLLCPQCLFRMNIQDERVGCQDFLALDGAAKRLASIVGYFEDRGPALYNKFIKEVWIE